MDVMDFIMDKIREKPDLSKPLVESDNKLMQDRDKQVKILVPNSTAGMIIGKAGNYIKQIKEASGSYVQISQKAKDVSLQERCITVIGESREKCFFFLTPNKNLTWPRALRSRRSFNGDEKNASEGRPRSCITVSLAHVLVLFCNQ